MSFVYHVGWPGWKIAARLGVPLKVKVSVLFDDEAKVFVAECIDFLPYLGIVTEAPTVDELQNKLTGLFEEAMAEAFKDHRHHKLSYSLTLVPASS